MSKTKILKSKVEKGIWIIYDLKANREIQKLLTKEELAFKFVPNLKIIEYKPKKRSIWRDILGV